MIPTKYQAMRPTSLLNILDRIVRGILRNTWPSRCESPATEPPKWVACCKRVQRHGSRGGADTQGRGQDFPTGGRGPQKRLQPVRWAGGEGLGGNRLKEGRQEEDREEGNEEDGKEGSKEGGQESGQEESIESSQKTISRQFASPLRGLAGKLELRPFRR